MKKASYMHVCFQVLSYTLISLFNLLSRNIVPVDIQALGICYGLRNVMA